MTKDLEETVNELGLEYRSVVDQLRAPFAASAAFRSPRPSSRPRSSLPARLLAASLILTVGLAVWFRHSAPLRDSGLTARSGCVSAPAVYTAACVAGEDAHHAILDSQRDDGSWSSDYLTMQNAAALRNAKDDVSRIAYKRAVRYLRTKGLGPISDAELRQRSSTAFPAG